MGIVYLARDPDLGRDVALKFVRIAEHSRARSRKHLLIEAQALAKLTHPNVVGVYDVGTHADGVFLAMEYIRGTTLRGWLSQESRSTQEVLDVLVEAGRGLAAAHQAGLTHRDFKPENILVGDDGRVCVADFGLACGLPTVLDGAVSRSQSGGAADTITRDGTVVGTPRYMSPEQYSGRQTSAYSDQFSFCLVALECLGRVSLKSPWQEATAQTAVEAACRHLPLTIRRALRRGLSPDPQARWSRLDPLLRVLAVGPRRQRLYRRLVAGVAGLAVVATVGWVGRARAVERSCVEAPQAEFEGVWGEERRSQVEASLGRLGAQPVVWGWAIDELDQIASRWVSTYTEACQAARVQGTQSAEIMGLRTGCLDQAKREFDIVVETLIEGGPDVLPEVDAILYHLPNLSGCSDVGSLWTSATSVDPKDVQLTMTGKLALTRARLHTQVGQVEAARSDLEQAQAVAKAVEQPSFDAQVQLTQGYVHLQQQDHQAAESHWTEVLELATRGGDWATAHAAAIALIELLGRVGEKHSFEDAQRYVPFAKGLAHGDPVREGSWRRAVADLRRAQGQLSEAEGLLREAASLSTDPVHRRQRAKNLHTLSRVLMQAGKPADAEVQARAYIDLATEVYGPLHPLTGGGFVVLAQCLTEQRRWEEAERAARRGLLAIQRTLGADNSHTILAGAVLGTVLLKSDQAVAAEAQLRAVDSRLSSLPGPHLQNLISVRSQLAEALSRQGRHDEALVLHRELVAQSVAALGLKHRQVMQLRVGLATELLRMGRREAAEAELRTIEALLPDGEIGDEDPRMAYFRFTVAQALRALGHDGEAEQHLRRVEQVYLDAGTPDRLELARVRSLLADVLLKQHRGVEARVPAEEAWRYFEDGEGPQSSRAAAAFVLARVLRELSTDDPSTAERAYRLARISVEDYTHAGPTHQASLDEVRTWLDAGPQEH